MAAKTDNVLRRELSAFLSGGNAHMGFDDAIADFQLKHINTKPPKVPYSFWHLLEHMRIVQWDIVEFVRNPDHISPDYPGGYWPPETRKCTTTEWETTIDGFRSDLQNALKIVNDPKTSFFSPIPHAKGYNILREIILIGDHNAYHTSEILTLRQIVGISPPEKW